MRRPDPAIRPAGLATATTLLALVAMAATGPSLGGRATRGGAADLPGVRAVALVVAAVADILGGKGASALDAAPLALITAPACAAVVVPRAVVIAAPAAMLLGPRRLDLPPPTR